MESEWCLVWILCSDIDRHIKTLICLCAADMGQFVSSWWLLGEEGLQVFLPIITGERFPIWQTGGRRSPAVACWASDHWVASSNPLRGKFRH